MLNVKRSHANQSRETNIPRTHLRDRSHATGRCVGVVKVLQGGQSLVTLRFLRGARRWKVRLESVVGRSGGRRTYVHGEQVTSIIATTNTARVLVLCIRANVFVRVGVVAVR